LNHNKSRQQAVTIWCWVRWQKTPFHLSTLKVISICFVVYFCASRSCSWSLIKAFPQTLIIFSVRTAQTYFYISLNVAISSGIKGIYDLSSTSETDGAVPWVRYDRCHISFDLSSFEKRNVFASHLMLQKKVSIVLYNCVLYNLVVEMAGLCIIEVLNICDMVYLESLLNESISTWMIWHNLFSIGLLSLRRTSKF
jgi:hypothetical protein